MFCIPFLLMHRFMHQLKDALNVSLLATFWLCWLQCAVLPCFFIVTVQRKSVVFCNSRRYWLLKCELCGLVDVHQHPTAAFRIDNLLIFMCVCVCIYKYTHISSKWMCIFYCGGLPICHRPVCKTEQLVF